MRKVQPAALQGSMTGKKNTGSDFIDEKQISTALQIK